MLASHHHPDEYFERITSRDTLLRNWPVRFILFAPSLKIVVWGWSLGSFANAVVTIPRRPGLSFFQLLSTHGSMHASITSHHDPNHTSQPHSINLNPSQSVSTHPSPHHPQVKLSCLLMMFLGIFTSITGQFSAAHFCQVCPARKTLCSRRVCALDKWT